MKKLLIFLAVVLAIALVIGIWVFVDRKLEEDLKKDLMEAMADHCDASVEYLYGRAGFFEVYSIDYEIVDMVEVHDDLIYTVYVNWYVQANKVWDDETDRSYWMSKVAGTSPEVLIVDGKTYFVSYSNEGYGGGCTLYYNDSGMLSGATHFADLNGYSDQKTGSGSYNVYCTYCGKAYRVTSSYGRRAQKGMHCGVSGCK